MLHTVISTSTSTPACSKKSPPPAVMTSPSTTTRNTLGKSRLSRCVNARLPTVGQPKLYLAITHLYTDYPLGDAMFTLGGKR